MVELDLLRRNVSSARDEYRAGRMALPQYLEVLSGAMDSLLAEVEDVKTRSVVYEEAGE